MGSDYISSWHCLSFCFLIHVSPECTNIKLWFQSQKRTKEPTDGRTTKNNITCTMPLAVDYYCLCNLGLPISGYSIFVRGKWYHAPDTATCTLQHDSYNLTNTALLYSCIHRLPPNTAYRVQRSDRISYQKNHFWIVCVQKRNPTLNLFC